MGELNLKSLKTWGLLIVAALVIWAVMTWPLPRYARTAIASSSHNTEKDGIRTMIPGDHLQILYQFWLAGDMITGGTPWFYDLYQFNYGDDESTRERSAYFMPFPLFYLLGAWVSRALGWNLGLILSVILSYVFTFILLRRYIDEDLTAFLLALICILLPYRWNTLLGGSPTGLAMMWPPLLMLGLDVAVRDERWAGGLAAGLSLILAFFSDTHVVFFGVLLAPAWCLVAFIARDNYGWRKGAFYWQILRALLPALVAAALVFVMVRAVKSDLAGSSMEAGRNINEVALFAPRPTGLFSWHADGVSRQAYLGWVLPLFLIAGWSALTLRSVRQGRQHIRQWLLLTVIIAGIAGAVCLALGPYGPAQGRLLMIVRKLVKPYEMVRQTGKIYCILPPLLAVAAVLAFSAISSALDRKALSRTLLAGVTVLMLVEYRAQISPTICRLTDEQGAYAAVAEDAAAHDRIPRALVVTLWPGDTHWSSLYQHYASLYRIRMVNGYRPVVPNWYIEKVFSFLDSVNMGELRDEQIEALLERNIRYVLLHEDAFPEKVSCYPVGFTLERLLGHPRLELLARDRRVWSFRILEEAREVEETVMPFFSPSRRWELERANGRGIEIVEDASAAAGQSVRLSVPGAYVHSRATATVDVRGQRWMVRVKGQGALECEVYVGEAVEAVQKIAVSSTGWEWLEIPVPALGRYAVISLKITAVEGDAELDTLLLAAGDVPAMAVGEELHLSPQSFFHAGYTKPDSDAVCLEPAYEPAGPVLYGLHVPFEPGRYELVLDYESRSPAGTDLGLVRLGEGIEAFGSAPVTAGEEARFAYAVHANLPLRMEFDFSRNGDIEIRGVTIRRLK